MKYKEINEWLAGELERVDRELINIEKFKSDGYESFTRAAGGEWIDDIAEEILDLKLQKLEFEQARVELMSA